jgi:hypothetical protein
MVDRHVSYSSSEAEEWPETRFSATRALSAVRKGQGRRAGL